MVIPLKLKPGLVIGHDNEQHTAFAGDNIQQRGQRQYQKLKTVPNIHPERFLI